MDRSLAVKNSALWAAYGDAIGFISELATLSNLKQRAGTNTLKITLPWKRRIDGKFGVTVTLPAGCYSDDTQLRLSVSRAISGSGNFDVEAFAKVELPLWSNYSLGAGRGSKLAASNLAKKNASWNSNFFATEDLQYVNMGGNGAAMRIQPHVWSFKADKKKQLLVKDIVRDAITTHGHLRGILGAVFHGLFLLHVIDTGEIPPPHEWFELARELDQVPSVVMDDEQMYLIWLPVWEKLSQKNFNEECKVVVKEITSDIDKIVSCNSVNDPSKYEKYVSILNAFDPSNRGSATKTALLASLLGYLYQGDPEKALTTSANTIGSDTDTIGTMAGALLGATVSHKPSGPLMDEAYICSEAERMFDISQGKPVPTFSYPDLLNWSPSPSTLDFLQSTQNGLEFSVFGKVTPCDSSQVSETNSFAWHWYKTSFGQSLLVKSRKVIKSAISEQENGASKYKMFAAQRTYTDEQLNLIKNERRNSQAQVSTGLFADKNEGGKKSDTYERTRPKGLTIDEAFERVLFSKFNPDVIGHMMLQFLDNDDSIERCIALAALIGKARIARLKYNKQ